MGKSTTGRVRATKQSNSKMIEFLGTPLLKPAYISMEKSVNPRPELELVGEQMAAALDHLAHIPLDDNAGYNDGVLAFKAIKARYMALEAKSEPVPLKW